MSDTQYNAPYVHSPMILDGVLNEPAWRQADEMTLCVPVSGQSPYEIGRVCFVWDDKYLYLGADLVDHDIIAQGTQDEQHHYRMGDVLELFIQPGGKVMYWEFHCTPKGHKVSFFYPSGGYVGLPNTIGYPSGLEVGVDVHGTLNSWQDKDKGWTVEMAVPWSCFAAQGVSRFQVSQWRVLVGRYNYGAQLQALELSSWPMLPKANFHMLEHYATLRLAP